MSYVATDPEAADLLVVGAGLAGLATALALAASDLACTLIAPRPSAQDIAKDTRSTALFGPSLTFLDRIGVMQGLAADAVPLVGLRLVDATGSLFRAPEVLFEASEIGETAFGMNVENAALLSALVARVEASPLIRWHASTARTVISDEALVSVGMADGSLARAPLVVGADGERSACRQAAGIATSTWSYPQVAIATRFAHRRPHERISTELHRRSGPLTTVPLAGNNSSLVWVETPAEAARLMALDETAFARELEGHIGGIFGEVSGLGRRASFPLSGVTAERMGARRIVLVGEAAHRLPPIGAQGLNLGLRDAAWLVDLVAAELAHGGDPGSDRLIASYEDARRNDVASRTLVVDTLNRSLIAGLLPLDMARGAGLALLKALGPVRRHFMREGMGPAGPLPALMRPL